MEEYEIDINQPEIELEDGVYRNCLWGGYEICLNGKLLCTSKIGVRGFDVPVYIIVENGNSKAYKGVYSS